MPRKLTKLEISMIADKRYTRSIAGEGLKDGQKIALEVYRLFKKEAVRRKNLEPKIRAKKVKKKKTKVGHIKPETKRKPPNI